MKLGDAKNKFIDDYFVKGCHSNKGYAYFGTGGGISDQQTSLVEPNFRPNGYDCGTLCLITVINLQRISLQILPILML